MRRLALARRRLYVELGLDILAGDLVRFGRAQPACGDHAPQHVELTLVGKVVVHDRVVAGWGLDQTCKERGRGRREVLWRFVEVGLGCGADAIGAVPEVDAIEIHREYLVLGIPLLDRDRQHELLNLSSQGFLRRQELDLDQLLRDRAAALVQATRRDVDPQRPSERGGGYRARTVEVPVSRREHPPPRAPPPAISAYSRLVQPRPRP